MVDLIEPIKGGCLCGEIRYCAKSSPKWISYCHCRMCQKAYGQAYGIFLGFEKGIILITQGEPKIYNSSAWCQRTFCNNCGSPIGANYSNLDGILLGTLDNPNEWPPNGCHLGIESKISWNIINDDLPQWRTEDDPDFKEALKAKGLINN